jgi:hypothetical protein
MVLLPLGIAGPPELPAAKASPKYQYGQISTVYSTARRSTLSWTWDGPDGTLNGDSAAALFEKLSTVKKENARKLDIFNWLGSQGWVLVISQKETVTEDKDERVLTQYVFRRP